tara:strand:+ start:249 stop:482 length:234 start_codon:yes stop_codon:yes gene_type:complete
MGKMKELAMEEQEKIHLESLYDAKYWEVLDTQYQEHQLAMRDLESEQEEEHFMKLYTMQDTVKSLSRLVLPKLPKKV